jgi:nitronate monooxygenase
MGTRFVASQEWGGPAWEQAAVLAATSDDTVQTRVYDLIGERPFPAENPDRVLRNTFIDRWNGRESEIAANREALQAEVAAGQQRADPSVVGVSAGVAAGLITAAQPAGVIVRDIVREAERQLRERPQMLLG